ncbi:MAG: hypothetical protein J3Q66DRAFT_91381 [Benniella sp.]|nr:MAG: hypothetical protein J3Q66DRAFT_91381 [Benniella sp.]
MQSSSLVPGSYQRPGMDYFVNIFKDPPNVDELLASVRPPPDSMEAFKLAKKHFVVNKALDLSDLEMGHDSTREKAFLSVLYLKSRLSLGKAERRTWCRSARFNLLESFAKEIRYVEPRLRGLTPKVLLDHHQCVIKLYRDLEEGLLAGAYPYWRPTRFSKIAQALSRIETSTGLIKLTLQNKKEKRCAKEARKMGMGKKGIQIYLEQQMELEQMTPTAQTAHAAQAAHTAQTAQVAQAAHTAQTAQTAHTVQTEQPQQLSKGRIDEVMVAVVVAMARNDHGVPIMVPAPDWERGRPFLTELAYEGEDKHEVPASMQPLPVNTTQPDYSRVNYFDNIFKDPHNVGELLARVRPPPVSVQAFKQAIPSLMAIDRHEQLKPKHLQVGNDSTRERAFVAALYLRDRLSLGEKNLQTWCTGSLAKRLDQVANEIRIAEPLLRGLHSDALLKHYERVITVYRAMEKEHPGAYPHRREQTHFFKIARRLSIIENNTGLLQLKKQRLEQRAERRMEREKEGRREEREKEERKQEREKEVRKEERAKANTMFERILDSHLATMNNEVEWPVDGGWDRALPTMTEGKEEKNDKMMIMKKKEKDMAWEQMLDDINNQAEDPYQDLLIMAQAKKKRNEALKKKEKRMKMMMVEMKIKMKRKIKNKKKKEKALVVKQINLAKRRYRDLLTTTQSEKKRNDEQRKKKKKGAIKASKWIQDPRLNTHGRAVMAGRQCNGSHQALPTVAGAKGKETSKGNARPNTMLQAILEIQADWPVKYHQALPTRTKAKEKENDEAPTIQSAPSRRHGYQL